MPDNFSIGSNTDLYTIREVTGLTIPAQEVILHVWNAQNIGEGIGLFSGKTGHNLLFKSLSAGDNITLVESASGITINSTGGESVSNSTFSAYTATTSLRFDGIEADIVYVSGQTAGKLNTSSFNIHSATTSSRFDGIEADIVYVSGQTAGKLNTSSFNIYSATTSLRFDGIEADIVYVSGETAGKLNTSSFNIYSANTATLISDKVDSANNGLTKSGNNIGLGGALTGDTTISGANSLLFTNTAIKFASNNLKIRNPANTFEYSFTGAPITGNRDIALPQLASGSNYKMMVVNSASAGTNLIPFGTSVGGSHSISSDLSYVNGTNTLSASNIIAPTSILVGGSSLTNASTILDLQSTTKGFLPPRMTTTQRDAIATPSEGMVVFNTTSKNLNVYTTAWEDIALGFYKKTVTLTPAQILNSFTVPVELIPAVAGKIIVPIYIVHKCDFNTIAYATNTTTVYNINGNAVSQTHDISFSADKFRVIQNALTSLNTDLNNLINQPLVFNTQVGNPTAGNSDIQINITYYLI